jgi:hypothetical protein
MMSLEKLIQEFENGNLAKNAWTHHAHLRVGAWYVWHLGPAEALITLRHRIRSLNDAHGTENSQNSGYHETITQFYINPALIHFWNKSE